MGKKQRCLHVKPVLLGFRAQVCFFSATCSKDQGFSTRADIKLNSHGIRWWNAIYRSTEVSDARMYGSAITSRVHIRMGNMWRCFTSIRFLCFTGLAVSKARIHLFIERRKSVYQCERYAEMMNRQREVFFVKTSHSTSFDGTKHIRGMQNGRIRRGAFH